MAAFSDRFMVKTSIDKVWDFYTDVKHLELITPKDMKLMIINTTSDRIIQGQEIWISAKIFTRTRTWHSKITFLKLYEYTDEMITGPFKRWIHLHKFYSIDGKRTQIINEIDFRLPYGILGRLLEVYVYNQLKKIFEHRKLITIKVLESY